MAASDTNGAEAPTGRLGVVTMLGTLAAAALAMLVAGCGGGDEPGTVEREQRLAHALAAESSAARPLQQRSSWRAGQLELINTHHDMQARVQWQAHAAAAHTSRSWPLVADANAFGRWQGWALNEGASRLAVVGEMASTGDGAPGASDEWVQVNFVSLDEPHGSTSAAALRLPGRYAGAWQHGDVLVVRAEQTASQAAQSGCQGLAREASAAGKSVQATLAIDLGSDSTPTRLSCALSD